MYLTKWDPFETLTSFHSDLDRLFTNRQTAPAKRGNDVRSNWLPAVDIHEDEESYHFDLEAPGIDKQDFNVSVEHNVLTIKGERKSKTEQSKKNFHRIEREYGTFARSFTLPEVADTEKVNAEYADGVLKVKIGKKAEVASKKTVPVS